MIFTSKDLFLLLIIDIYYFKDLRLVNPFTMLSSSDLKDRIG